MDDNILYKEISYEIVAAAIDVWKNLGYGFLEKVYENALMIELRKRKIRCEQQKPIRVHYDGEIIGDFFGDIVVNEEIILELKSGKGIDDAHIAQVLHYLKATGLRLGLILNFGPGGLVFKRVVL